MQELLGGLSSQVRAAALALSDSRYQRLSQRSYLALGVLSAHQRIATAELSKRQRQLARLRSAVVEQHQAAEQLRRLQGGRIKVAQELGEKTQELKATNRALAAAYQERDKADGEAAADAERARMQVGAGACRHGVGRQTCTRL